MIITLLLNVVVYIVNVAFSWLPTVSNLPVISGFDMDNAMMVVSGFLHGAIEALPPMAIVITCLMWYYGIKMTLLTWNFIQWVIKLIRG